MDYDIPRLGKRADVIILLNRVDFVMEFKVGSGEFLRHVDVQNLIVPMSEHRTFKYFKEETLERYANEYG